MALQSPCKKCKTKISLKSTVCPNCGIKHPFATIGSHIFTVIVFAAIIGIGIKACTPEPKTPEQIKAAAAAKIDKACRDKVSAVVISETFIKRQLKSPSTAVFPNYMADGVSINYLGDCTNVVTSFVDSQNGFGAMIRSKYSVELKYNPEDQMYTPLNIIIE